MRTNFGCAPRIVLAAATLVLTGCAGFETEVNSLSFHEGQAESNEQILLRNIIMAAHDKTPTFVAASSISSQGKASAGVSAAFNHINSVGHIVTPTLGSERGQTVSILDYGATKAAQHLYKESPPNLVRQLVIRGWPSHLIETILFNGIRVPAELDHAIKQSAIRICRTTDAIHLRNICGLTNELITECGDPIGKVAYLNTARTRCDFYTFQILLNRLFVTKSIFGVREHKISIEKGVQVDIGKLVPVFGDRHISNVYKRIGRKPHVAGFEFAIRSPKQIIDFLGRLAALQLFSDSPHAPRMLVPTGRSSEWIVPFRVVRAKDLTGPSAVSIRVDAETLYVPASDPTAAGGDQSVRVMALMIELQNIARQEAPIQGTGVAILQ